MQRRDPGRIRKALVLPLVLALAGQATAQSFHGTPSPKADAGAWRKIELWKKSLVDEENQQHAATLLKNKDRIQAGSSALPDLRKAIGVEETADRSEVRQILDSEYVVLTIGYFDLYYPTWYLQDNAKVKELKRCALALLDMQGKFLDWVGLEAAARASEKANEPPARGAVIELREQYDRWKPKALSPSTLGQARERFEELNRSPTARAFATYMRRQTWMEEEGRGALPADADGELRPGFGVVMAPDWQNFLGVACAFSVLDEVEERKPDGERMADFVWYDGLPTWTYFYWYEVQGDELLHFEVVASEYASTDQGEVWPLETPGAPMDEVTQKKTGLEQHLVQHIGERFLHQNYNARMHLPVQNGIATDIVFELYDENKERSSGSGVASQTQAREVFVPGAPSQGGFLPSISADNRVRRAWKSKKGGGDRFQYFLEHEIPRGKDLAKKQLGKERAGEHAYFFPIHPTNDNLDKVVVYPPLLTLPGEDQRDFFKGVPYSQYAPDHRAFFRAYKVYFAWWLRTRGAASAEDRDKEVEAHSKKAFADFLLLAARKAKEAGPTYAGDTIGIQPFVEAVEEVYGMPLSGEHISDPEHASLEARCLATFD